MNEMLYDIPMWKANNTAGPTIGTDFSSGVLLSRYPYRRPSRNRCSLYVCREVLRIVMEILLFQRSQDTATLTKNPTQASQPTASSLSNTTVHIDIFTDSTHVMDLLHNSTRLLEWGSFPTQDELFRHHNITTGQAWANWDILYPLARTYWRLIRQIMLVRQSNSTIHNERVELARGIVIRFRHTSEWMLSSPSSSRPDAATPHDGDDDTAWWSKETVQTAGTMAQKAATWQFERQNKVRQ